MFDSITFIWGTIIGIFTCYLLWSAKRSQDSSKHGLLFYIKKYWYYPIFWIPLYIVAIGFYY